ncbi:hypothetical protein Q428_08540 [Fervidicella metallireducens AeB]|uniref:Putative restriction endonuclease domain-containing protein n=1 Tax=Fervidicella metallireducens AeB TaxID=1403537 RepID=A0A017RUP8_9CLOT|nr:Uma2 family endonuclease [Fervidicella metallireducens]EYE88346.1 hypothetical protein Q428_08540 [Fervidicella metallireducens AeB]
MALAKSSFISIEEFYKMRDNSESLLEYIDGVVYMTPSPSTKHQRVSSRLQIKLGLFVEGTSCEVFGAPYDIELKREDIEGTKIVIPDISVICDKSGFTEAKYIGVPALIVEILSPSNQSHDLITKLNLYMKYGVKEYWIVNPMLESVTVYTLNDEEMYEQYDMKAIRGEVKSKILDGFSIDLEYIYK